MNKSTHSNHQPNILYQSNLGYVVHCYSCKNFQIAYGTVIIYQDLQGFQSLLGVLEIYYEEFKDQAKNNCRCIQINTPAEDFNLLFSLSELTEFINMLNKAYLVFQAERLANGLH